MLCACRMLGAVVVGIGTAGWVRIRDLLSVPPGSPAEKIALRGFVSRYSNNTAHFLLSPTAALTGVPLLSVERQQIDAVF